MNNGHKVFLVILVLIIAASAGIIFWVSRGQKGKVATGTNENGQVAGVSTNGTNSVQPDSSLTKDENGNPFDSNYIEKLAKFLSEKGMVMYGASWCTHCKAQKAAFGDAVQYIDYVECDSSTAGNNADECNSVSYTDSSGKKVTGIQGYPTWIYQGTAYSGEQKLSDLANIVGFSE